MPNVSIVIPIYKNELNSFETVSILRAFNIFKNEHISLVIPENLIITNPIFENKTFEIVKFDSSFFVSIASYNSLLLSFDFYEKFASFNFILIYQSDCYVFENQIQHWINKDYDYIGAPWFWDCFYNKQKLKKIMYEVGNGGLSLRKVNSFVKILKSQKEIKFNYALFLKMESSKHLGLVKYIYSKLAYLFDKVFCVKKYNANNYINKNVIEDVFWSIIAPKFDNNFLIANIDDGINFCFEMYPEYLYELNNKQLPFCAHAWERYNIDFFKQWINIEN